MAESAVPARRWLRVHVRSTALSDGGSLRSYEVYCPRQGRFVALSECESCRHRLAIDGGERELFVDCDAADRYAPEAELTEARPSWASVTTVGDVMARHVFCVGLEIPLAQLVHLLVDQAISGVPVVDGEGRPVGIATKTDVIAAVDASDPAALERLTVADVMTSLAFTVSPDTPVARAAALMAFEGIHRIPVVSEQNHVVGLLSSLDVLRWLARSAGYMMPAAPHR